MIKEPITLWTVSTFTISSSPTSTPGLSEDTKFKCSPVWRLKPNALAGSIASTVNETVFPSSFSPAFNASSNSAVVYSAVDAEAAQPTRAIIVQRQRISSSACFVNFILSSPSDPSLFSFMPFRFYHITDVFWTVNIANRLRTNEILLFFVPRKQHNSQTIYNPE